MKRVISCVAAVTAGTVLLAVSIAGETRSLAGIYDLSTTVAVNGKVVRVDFKNPRVHIEVEVKETNGTVKSWLFELPGPNQLIRLGWMVDSLKVGAAVTVNGHQGKQITNNGLARQVVFAGRTFSF
jgi:hypothetical protein